ncbi:flavoprotein-domain-containing protein [Lasiosphaeria miniovina]|uniref:Flavoprotein-domain-containing protein n=1 Tax=Lasiosphaeria miniovina TaxID=1954250 RepID=A0AA40E6R7_9PEZI|nr:flavoprotein-domain-containing protein [Lasiosphaeria miniovina]KAK0727102.1 flavoprotein-domain-containing protein [Lasiosphaeria miniovina]
MLQFVSDSHDNQHAREQSSSLASLTAARADTQRKHLLLAASGSVATIKIPEIVKALAKHADQLAIRIVLTDSARNFLNGQSSEQPTVSSLLHLPNVEAVYSDADEWGPQPWRRGASILHIECHPLPLFPHTSVPAILKKRNNVQIVNGISDNLLTSVIRAWDTDTTIDNKKKVIVVAPAMNSAMWRHPITAKQVRVLAEDWGVQGYGEPATIEAGSATEATAPGQATGGGWFQVIKAISIRTLACGDTGGAMASVDSIRATIEARLSLPVRGLD